MYAVLQYVHVQLLCLNALFMIVLMCMKTVVELCLLRTIYSTECDSPGAETNCIFC